MKYSTPTPPPSTSVETPPTLLVFTLGASWEARRRHLLPEHWSQAERALHRACLDEVLAAGRANGCLLTVSTPTAASSELPKDAAWLPQSGEDFGSRLRGAWVETQSCSAGPVLLVGSDVPGLKARHLGQALDSLAEDPDRVVIGPSPDGGFYLLASNRPLDRVLASVCWCCRDTLSSLRQALAREGFEATLLAPLRDLDCRADLEMLLAALVKSAGPSWRALFRWLLTLWREMRRPLLLSPVPVPLTKPQSVCRGRAPPSLTSLFFFVTS